MTETKQNRLNAVDSSDFVFDAAVIGGGVVGCAMVRRFALEGVRAILIEKSADILAGASKANSAILHTGFDAPAESLELACIQDGYREYMEIRGRLGLPVLETGALVVAWTEQDQIRLEGIEAQAMRNGVTDVRRIGRTELREREPHLAESARAALLVPREFVIDPWSAPLAYLRQALENGAEARFEAEVVSGTFSGSDWNLETTAGRVRARAVINCAGLYGDILEQRLLGNSGFTIHPRKGQFVVFDKAASRLVRSILLPVPSERTKGIVVTRTVFGNVLVGPTAEEQDGRERAAVDSKTLAGLIQRASEILPALRGMPVTAVYAGLRPATERKDYRIRFDRERHWLAAGGIRSTGLSAALGIANHVFRLYRGDGAAAGLAGELIWPKMPNLAEHCPRDWETPGYGEIVCHCEMVTRREIEQALTGPLPAKDSGGLKRRTRAAMGCCQGFYCSGRLADLTRGRWKEPLAVGAARA